MNRSEQDGCIGIAPNSDGSATLGISCFESEKDVIEEAFKAIVQECQDNTFGLYDKIRDAEHRAASVLVQDRTFRLHFGIKETVRRRAREMSE